MSCNNVDVPIYQTGYQLNNSCDIIAATSNPYDRAVATFTGVSNINFNTYRSFKFILCEYDDDSFTNGTLIRNAYGSYSNDELNPNKYYSYYLYKPNDCVDCLSLQYCSQKSQIAIMSEELAFGSGDSIFSNLNELTPLFIVLIGFILGYYFLRKIIKKGENGRTL